MATATASSYATDVGSGVAELVGSTSTGLLVASASSVRNRRRMVSSRSSCCCHKPRSRPGTLVGVALSYDLPCGRPCRRAELRRKAAKQRCTMSPIRFPDTESFSATLAPHLISRSALSEPTGLPSAAILQRMPLASWRGWCQRRSGQKTRQPALESCGSSWIGAGSS